MLMQELHYVICLAGSLYISSIQWIDIFFLLMITVWPHGGVLIGPGEPSRSPPCPSGQQMRPGAMVHTREKTSGEGQNFG